MNYDKKLTIFTPTYNREKLLGECYRSLCNQTCKDFKWLIIDDGSTDHTREEVKAWSDENKIEIQYVYKVNGGLHSGYNKAYELCNTELLMCLDSDDDLKPKAVQIILESSQGEEFEKLLGIVANQHYRKSGKVIGTALPSNIEHISYYDIYYKYNVTGDKVFVIKTKYVKGFRFPEFSNEKLYPTGDVYLKIQGEYKVVHESIYMKEYLETGYTLNHMAQYVLNPRSYAESHKFRMVAIKKKKNMIKSTIHYIACSKLAEQKWIIRNSPRKAVTIVLYPFGLLWYLFLVIKKRISHIKL